MQSQSDHVLEQQLISLYREFHKIPQIGLQEHETTNLIKEYIQSLTHINTKLRILQPQKQTDLKTGLIVHLESPNSSIDPSTNPNNNICKKQSYLFRCDIDALPFKEQSGLHYASQNGMHHACGHDAHTAIMLIAIKLICAQADQLTRDLYFVFQPGEQGHGGASKLLQQYPSLLPLITKSFALHIGNHRPKSQLLIASRFATSNSTRFHIEVIGKSTHCMLPHIAIDANYIGCQIVNEIYSVKARLLEPMGGMAICVTRVEGTASSGGVAAISDSMRIWGSVRSFEAKYHQRVLEHIQKFASAICQLNGAQLKFTVGGKFYRAVQNEKSAIEVVAKAGHSLFKQVQYTQPSFAGQDFCQFSQKTPSCYFILGVGLPNSFHEDMGQSKYPIHSNKFMLDESALYNGCLLWRQIAYSS